MFLLYVCSSMLLVTIYGNYRTPVEALRQSLLSRLQIISSINISSMQRFGKQCILVTPVSLHQWSIAIIIVCSSNMAL